MGNKTPGFEIERKFLIHMPDRIWLEEKASHIYKMRQTYLASENGKNARVRQITEGDTVRYVHTVKKRISDLKREETEQEISLEAYEALLKCADPERKTIEKTRYCVPYGQHLMEIDIFPFWKDKVFLEIELSEESEAFALPTEIRVIREVTSDKRYTNAALSKELPE